MDRKTKICVWVICLGLANFVGYIVGYSIIGGEAVNGTVLVEPGQGDRFFLQTGQPVSRGVFIYSGVHSISVWLTVGAIMLAMLTLAKDRISAPSAATIARGRTIITAIAVVIGVCTSIMTYQFTHDFLGHFRSPRPVNIVPTQPGPPR